RIASSLGRRQRRRTRGERVVVEPLVAWDDLGGAVALRGEPRLPAERRAARAVGEQRLERRTDRLGLERVEQDAGAAVLDVFAEAAPRGDDRLAARHRLEPGERKVLRARWERANRGAVDVALDVGREPDEADVRQTVI